jgi:hypothetical protein
MLTVESAGGYRWLWRPDHNAERHISFAHAYREAHYTMPIAHTVFITEPHR